LNDEDGRLFVPVAALLLVGVMATAIAAVHWRPQRGEPWPRAA